MIADPHDFVFIPGQGIQNTEQKNPWDIAFYVYQEFWQSEGDPNRKANFMIGRGSGCGAGDAWGPRRLGSSGEAARSEPASAVSSEWVNSESGSEIGEFSPSSLGLIVEKLPQPQSHAAQARPGTRRMTRAIKEARACDAKP